MRQTAIWTCQKVCSLFSRYLKQKGTIVMSKNEVKLIILCILKHLQRWASGAIPLSPAVAALLEGAVREPPDELQPDVCVGSHRARKAVLQAQWRSLASGSCCPLSPQAILPSLLLPAFLHW